MRDPVGFVNRPVVVANSRVVGLKEEEDVASGETSERDRGQLVGKRKE